jgi:16S rRNA U1498 N3-methylase RsmE
MTHTVRSLIDHALAVVIGPDTGVAGEELAAARRAGACVCHAVDATLRAETAAIVAVGVAFAATGHLERQSEPSSRTGASGA